MHSHRCVASLLWLGLTAAAAAQGPLTAAQQRAAEASMFARHSIQVTPLTALPHRSVRIDTQLKRRYRTRLREAVEKAPTFADSVSYAEWGCGTGCFQFGLVDRRTGTAYIFPRPVQAYAVGNRVDHRRESRALHVVGQLGDADGGGVDDWYWWNGHTLLRIAHRRLPEDCFWGDHEDLRNSVVCGFMPPE